MPADPPSSSVEARLRDAARQRRDAFDAAGPDAASMPGPTRARLHEELARRFDVPRAASPNRWARWWPALAGAVGTAAAVFLFIVAGQGPSGPPTVAQNAASVPPPPPAEVKEEAAALPAPATAPALPEVAAPSPARQVASSADKADAAAGTLAKAKDATGSRAGAGLSRAEPVRTQTFTQSPLPLAAAATRSPAFARPAAPASAPETAAAAGRRRGDSEAPAATSAPGSAPAPVALLGNFRFEQRGESVRVVDADGSVYVGQVESGAEMKAAKPNAQAPRLNQAAPTQQASEFKQDASENFRFRATGDNRTLRKPVVFEGEYSLPAPEAPAPAAKKESAVAAPRSFSNPEAQIRGRVRVLDSRDDQRGAEVDARSVEPR